MKSKKLKLKDLEVKSFITSLKDAEKHTLKEVMGGGSGGNWCPTCQWNATPCPINSNHPDFCTRKVDGCAIEAL